MNFYAFVAVGIGGMLGSIARFITSKVIDEKIGGLFPYGTLTVNVIGSFILGFLFGLSLRKTGIPIDNWRLFLGTGFCGGFTTFSAFALENFTLLHQRPGISLLYIGISIVAGIIAVALGFFAAKAI